MNFYEITCESACAANAHAKSREDILRLIASQAKKADALANLSEEEIYQALLARELEGSTGFGNGLALPHARFKGAEHFVFFIVTTERGIPFDAIDKKKVNVFCVLLGPADAAREHLRILASVSNLMARTNLLAELRNAMSAAVISELFLRTTSDEKPAHMQEHQKLLMVVLYEERFLYDLLEFFIEQGIDGATILDSSGMGKYISNIPLFASFVGFMKEDRNLSRTIMANIPESRVDDMIEGIEKITGDLDKQQGAMIMVLDLAYCKGTMKMM